MDRDRLGKKKEKKNSMNNEPVRLKKKLKYLGTRIRPRFQVKLFKRNAYGRLPAHPSITDVYHRRSTVPSPSAWNADQC